MADFDEDDFDIDELLDEIDTSGTKGKAKGSSGGTSSGGSASADKSNKSVRFASDGGADAGTPGDNEDLSKPGRSQREPSAPAPLRTMFIANNANQSSSTSVVAGSKPSSARSGRSFSAASSATSKDDWLGIQDTQTDQSNPDNFLDDEKALFKELGLPRSSESPRRRSEINPLIPTPTADSQQQPTSHPQPRSQRFGPSAFGDSATGTPPISLGGDQSGAMSGMSSSTKPFSSSMLDQLGMSPPGGSPRTSLDLNKPPMTLSKPSTPQTQPQQPFPTSAPSFLGMESQSQMPSFPPKNPLSAPRLPSAETVQFSLSAGGPPSIAKRTSTESIQSFSLTGPPANPNPQDAFSQQQFAAPPKKKGAKGALAVVAPSHTLQLPTHLINEEELKAMSSSLKTLYSNQLELLEKSYREQMEFLSDASRRKDELHRDEMRALQTDYEERLERLKAEIRDMESKHPQRSSSESKEDIASIATLSEQLNTGITTLRDVLQKARETSTSISSNDTRTNQQLVQLVQQNNKIHEEKFVGMEGRVCGMMKNLDESVAKKFSGMNDAWRNLNSVMKENLNEVLETAQASNVDKLEKLLAGKEDQTPKIVQKLEESEKLVLGEMAKIQKVQRKVRENTDNMSLEPLVKLLESDRDDENRRKEKLATQVKEMRRDLKRILLEGDARQETNQKSNMTSEMELKAISQLIRDLNSQLKYSLISGPTHPENLTNKFNTSMQQTQAEMEMKLLREERQALSESMAQINVEKRKVSEEKIHLEKQKMDFEREKDKLGNMEIQLKTKMDETTEIQRKAESVRREEIQLSSEVQVKLREVEKEKSILRQRLSDAEQKLKMWESRLRQEKVELMREREFMEKLRDQLLCPGCLKHNETAGTIHPPPPPYIPMDHMPGSTNSHLMQHHNMPPLTPPTNINLADYFGQDDNFLELYYRKLFE